MSRPARILGVLLAVSLALNVFILGFIAARAWQRPGLGPDGRGPRPPPATLFHADRVLGEASPGKLKWLTQEQRQQLVPHWRALRAARRDAEQALRAEPFDRAAFERSLERVRGETVSTQSTLHGLLVGLADGMTPEQRTELARLNWRQERDRDGKRGRHRWREQRAARGGDKPDAGAR
jgi:uncharacterized membrane protein